MLLCLFFPQIVGFVNNLLSHSDAFNLLFPLESECHCSLEVCATTKHKSSPTFIFLGGGGAGGVLISEFLLMSSLLLKVKSR